MPWNLIKQLFAIFLAATTVLLIVAAINEGDYRYVVGAIFAAVFSYLFVKK
jgi:hypothetical protein